MQPGPGHRFATPATRDAPGWSADGFGHSIAPRASRAPAKMPTSDKHRLYWRRVLRLTLMLLGAWFVLTVALSVFARELSFQLFGWPFSFWMASQGALFVFCGLVWAYALLMDRLDAEQRTPRDD